MNILQEDTRNQLIATSRNAGNYKDQSHGKNRFDRKRFSKIATTVKQFNTVNMDDFFKRDTLIINVPVTGETDNYNVTIKMEGIVTEIAKNIKNNKNILEYKTILQAVLKIFNSADIYVKCTCDDFKYRFKHFSIINNYGVDDSSADPGPGKGIANPNNDMGKGCKHIMAVIANTDWIMKVTSVISNYIHYTEEHMQKAFLAIIFPKLYGIPASEAVDKNLLPEDENLETDKHVIETINEWAKNRGKIQKGSNINPVYADKLEKQQSGKQKTEDNEDEDESNDDT